jgi:folate-binding protein YgfZ
MSSLSHQYHTIALGAGWIEKRARGRLTLSGRDAVPFLHALVTNDVASLEIDQGTYAAYLTPQGRMIADLIIYRRADRLVADVPRDRAAALASRLDGLVFTEDVAVRDDSDALGQIMVVGAGAARAVAAALEASEVAVSALALRSQVASGDLFAARTDDAPWPSFDVVFPSARRASLVETLEAAGAIALTDDVTEALRIEAGRPAFGVDMTEETIPLEAGLLDRAINQSKGCYVGQEVIVRVLHRGGGRIAKRLVQLTACDEGAPLACGATISDGSDEVGRVTSAAFSPRLERGIALGYVRREGAEVGRRYLAGGAAVEVVGLAA